MDRYAPLLTGMPGFDTEVLLHVQVDKVSNVLKWLTNFKRKQINRFSVLQCVGFPIRSSLTDGLMFGCGGHEIAI